MVDTLPDVRVLATNYIVCKMFYTDEQTRIAYLVLYQFSIRFPWGKAVSRNWRVSTATRQLGTYGIDICFEHR